MAETLSWFSLITSTLALLLAATCVVVCWRVGSRFSSMANRWKASAQSVESFDSRMKALEERYASVSKREHLNARRDPVTGRSVRAVETKEDVRRRLGLVGANAARVAHSIHTSGGLAK